MELAPEHRQKIADRLLECRALLPCSRCGGKLEEGALGIGDLVCFKKIPGKERLYVAATVICARCGLISLHLLSSIGLQSIVTEMFGDDVIDYHR